MEEELISALQELESIRTGFRAKCRKLRRQILRLDLQTLGVRENAYRELESDIAKFQANLDIWEGLLPEDEQGLLIYPEYGVEAGGAFGGERATEMLIDFQKELHGVKMDFVKFKSQEDTTTQLMIA